MYTHNVYVSIIVYLIYHVKAKREERTNDGRKKMAGQNAYKAFK